MDLDMPLKNGIQTTEELFDFCKANKLVLPHVLLCTARIDQQISDICKNVGMEYILMKPISKESLVKALEMFYY